MCVAVPLGGHITQCTGSLCQYYAHLYLKFGKLQKGQIWYTGSRVSRVFYGTSILTGLQHFITHLLTYFNIPLDT